MKIIQDIKKIIADANKETDINRLIDLNMRLSGYLFYLSEEETAAHKAALDAYNERKQFEAMHVIQSTEAVSKSEKRAIVESKQLRSIEAATEAIYQHIKNIRYSGSGFVDVLQQKIAFLRREDELSRRSNSNP